MREIKFRAWDKENDVMLPWEQLKSQEYQSAMNGNYPTFSFSRLEEISERYELMQYTGLTDKNGKEIYEGDFIAVEYTVGEGFAYYFTAEMPDIYERQALEKWVILRNVYENPELLAEPNTTA